MRKSIDFRGYSPGFENCENENLRGERGFDLVPNCFDIGMPLPAIQNAQHKLIMGIVGRIRSKPLTRDLAFERVGWLVHRLDPRTTTFEAHVRFRKRAVAKFRRATRLTVFGEAHLQRIVGKYAAYLQCISHSSLAGQGCPIPSGD